MTTQEATHAPAVAGEEMIHIQVTPFPPEEEPPFLEAVTAPAVLDTLPAEVLRPETDVVLEEPGVLAPEPSVVAPEPPAEVSEAPAAAAPQAPAAFPRPPARRRPPVQEPARKVNQVAPDPFAVGVRLLRMAPAWLLFITVVCGTLVLVLGWVRADENSSAAKLPPKQNDSRAVAAEPKPETPAPKSAAANSPEVAAVPAAPTAKTPNSPPAQAPAQAAAPAPAAPAQPAPAAAPKPVEQPAPAESAGGKFTVQVGSYNSQSEANEHVSRLRAAGFASRAAAVELPGRGTWYRVQVGRYADRAEASKAAGELRTKGGAAAAIVAPL
jgi:cell division septation protein DedD